MSNWVFLTSYMKDYKRNCIQAFSSKDQHNIFAADWVLITSLLFLVDAEDTEKHSFGFVFVPFYILKE